MKRRKDSTGNRRKTIRAEIVASNCCPVAVRRQTSIKKYLKKSVNEVDADIKPPKFINAQEAIIKYLRETAKMDNLPIKEEVTVKEEIATESCNQEMSEEIVSVEEIVEEHEEIKSTEDLICDFCGKKFISKCVLTQHMFKSHLASDIKCLQCDKRFTRQFSLKRHQMYAHCKNDSCNCPRCGKIFARKDYLIKHIQETHEKIQGDRFKCNICLKIFTRLYALKRHQTDVHESPAVLICSWCGKKFTRKFNLNRHVQMIHVEAADREYVCFHCEKSFTKKHRLLFHMKKRHLESDCNVVKRFACSQCPKIFVNGFNLRRHTTTVHEKCKTFECGQCSRMFSFYHNLKRHLASVHPEEADSSNASDAVKQLYLCTACDKTFSRPHDLTRHLRRSHYSTEEKPFICAFCDGRFPCKKTISTHIKRRHQMGTVSKILCCLCKKPCDTSRDALEHYTEVHNISVEYEYPQFSSFNEFKDWMTKMEKATLCRYVKSKTYKCEADVRFVFVCHRSGFYECKSSDRKRQMKKAGLKKLNGFCPANIRVVSNNSDGSCHITFLKTHVGHTVEDERELQYCYLTEDERRNIAAKISAGIPLRNILSECLSLAQKSELHRKFGALQIRDLHNISAAYNLKQNQSNKVPQGSLNINAFLEKHADAILFYKQQFKQDSTYKVFEDNDLVLIIMTDHQQVILKSYAEKVVAICSTHAASNDNFFLHTLLVLDNDNEGIIAAFALSNRNDESLMDVFLTCIKHRIGCIQTNVLITYTEGFHYKSWTKIMSLPRHHLYCMWHVKKTWYQNLNKIANREKQKFVRHQLGLISRERNEAIFLNKLNFLIKSDDPDLREFIDYFQTNFISNIKLWANWYRRCAGINSDLDLDAFHKVMKYVLGGDKKIRNLAHCLRTLTDYISLKENDFKIKEVRGKQTFEIQMLKMAHARAIQQLEQGGVPLEMIDDNKWRITSSISCVTHTIEKNSSTNCSNALKTCQLLCRECGDCFHHYTCTCRDYIINDNMCEHIHIVCIFLNNSDDAFPTFIGNSPECSNICAYEVEDYSSSSVAVVSTEEVFQEMDESYQSTYPSACDNRNILPSSEIGTSDQASVSSITIVPEMQKSGVRDEAQRLIDEFKNFITEKANNLNDIHMIRSNFSKLISPTLEQRSD